MRLGLVAMRIGIHPALKRHDGGIYQYAVTMLDSLRVWTDAERHKNGWCQDEFVVFAHDPDHAALAALNGSSWEVRTFRPPWAPTELGGSRDLPDPDVPQSQPDMRTWLLECGVELMIYPSPHRLAFETRVPYVMAIHDLQHRLQPEFPEVSADCQARQREYLARNGARYATLLVADSETGKADIVDCYGQYGVTADRIRVLPYASSRPTDCRSVEIHRQRVKTEYDLPDRYLFYPAQFWPHKNHLGLIEALGMLSRDHGLDIPLVLTGSAGDDIRARTLAAVMALAEDTAISSRVTNLGYVPDDDVVGLYAGAVAMVMPTFFGPTNIPVLEAWALGCPVLTSDVSGIREQVADAAVRVDPRSVSSIADGIHRLWSDETLRQTLAHKGRLRVSGYTLKDFGRRLIEIIGEAKDRVRRKNACIPAV